MNTLAITSFARPASSAPLLPSGSSLELPSGWMEVWDEGRLFSFGHHWVVAVGLSPETFLVMQERVDRLVPGRLLHELMGWLTAHQRKLVVLDFRCPLAWRHGSSFQAVRYLLASRSFETSEHLLFQMPLPLSARPSVALPLETIAADSAVFWQQAGLVADAMLAGEEPPDPRIWRLLAKISAIWEHRWNQALASASEAEVPHEGHWFQKCDEAWAAVVHRHLLPSGYRMQPASIARLL